MPHPLSLNKGESAGLSSFGSSPKPKHLVLRAHISPSSAIQNRIKMIFLSDLTIWISITLKERYEPKKWDILKQTNLDLFSRSLKLFPLCFWLQVGAPQWVTVRGGGGGLSLFYMLATQLLMLEVYLWTSEPPNFHILDVEPAKDETC